MIKVFLDKDGDCEWESFSTVETTRNYIEVPDDTDLSGKCVEGGVLRDKTPEEIEATNYQAGLEQAHQSRRQEYGAIEDQLDEIFHNIDAWRSRIQDIKTRHPLPPSQD